ncbi:glycosyltransferase family 39 protein [Streptomyces sp. NPDC096046]|uniref:ArnT family glycosyltransferase n=1 Tax=Streptomyces sp. NPDC096046 TaxID=3155542 RepID=UPI00332A2F16
MSSVTHGPPPVTARTEPPTSSPTGDGSRLRGWALAGICVLAGLLYVWLIGSSNYGNAYYSAAVRSMTESPANFLFGAADPYGAVSVDKPPLALWPQVASVAMFGYSSWSLLLPQVLEGVAAVFLLHRTVRLWAGEAVALLASLILALTPVTVAINRDNNTDSLLTLLLVASAYAFMRSIRAEEGRSRTKWLLACAFLVGCGFTAKMLQAWIIVPVLALAFLVSSTSPLKRRINDVLAAGAVLIVSSFWWPVLHDLWPGDKPYMGGSTDGSALELVFGYNGFGALLGTGQQPGGSGINVPLAMVGLSGGSPGVTRMFSAEVGDQISWLLPLSGLVLFVAGAAGYRRLWFEIPGDPRQRAGWVLWGGWLVLAGGVLSFTQGIFNTYYTTMLAPAIGAVSAAGIAMLWRKYRDPVGHEWLLLPATVALTALWAFVLVSRDTSWHGWTRWATAGVGGVALAGLIAGRLSARRRAWGRPVLVAGVASMLLAPAVWSVGTAATASDNGGFPSAGPPNNAFSALLRGELPDDMMMPGGMAMPGSGQMPDGMELPGMEPPEGMKLPDGMPMSAGSLASGGSQTPGKEGARPGARSGNGFGGAELSAENRRILRYAQQNSDGAAITLAVEGGGLASSSFIIGTGATVVGMGGFLGADDAPSVDQLGRWVAEGEVRFFLTAHPGEARLGGMAGMGGTVQRKRVDWVQQNCEVVEPSAYGGRPFDEDQAQLPLPGFSDATLYRC